MTKRSTENQLMVTAGTFLGIGLGGFIDGILFHQILQTHSMLSARFPKTSIQNIEINMFWDGLFHAATWLMSAIGVALLWRAGAARQTPWSGTHFLGALFFGWGLFNFIEGLIDHHLLHLHHVVERHGVSLFDYAFLASGIIFLVGGWLAMRHDPVR
ncbi:MAG: DUF2243 domain-containing protein [Verrucomicrobiota bacterium]